MGMNDFILIKFYYTNLYILSGNMKLIYTKGKRYLINGKRVIHPVNNTDAVIVFKCWKLYF